MVSDVSFRTKCQIGPVLPVTYLVLSGAILGPIYPRLSKESEYLLLTWMRFGEANKDKTSAEQLAIVDDVDDEFSATYDRRYESAVDNLPQVNNPVYRGCRYISHSLWTCTRSSH